MVFNLTSTSRGRSGDILIDMLVGVGLDSLVFMILSLLLLFGGRSFGAMANYVSLDQRSRNALDRMSKEIRQCNRLTGCDTNYLIFEDYDGGTLLYFYSPDAKTLYRFKNWRQDPGPLLDGCGFLKF